jgi:hypothetical protein
VVFCIECKFIKKFLHTCLRHKGSHSGVIKSYILWDITPSSSLKVNRRFRAIYIQLSTRFKLISCLACFDPAGLHCVIFQKIGKGKVVPVLNELSITP